MSQLLNQPTPASPADAKPVILQAQGIHKKFRMGDSELHILRGVDLAVRAGEFIAIEGRSGSGKSTLLHILGALDEVDGGKTLFETLDYTRRRTSPSAFVRSMTSRGMRRLWWVMLVVSILASAIAVASWKPLTGWIAAGVGAVFAVVTILHWGPVLLRVIDDYPVERARARVRNREFGFVFQFYHLLPELNVVENVLLTAMVEHSWFNYSSKRTELRERATRILTDLGMEHRLTHRPQQLSGGERQRVAIARALMNGPRVLFADEPTGNLDYDTGRQIMAVLEKLHRDHGQTIIMVTHDRALARTADRVFVLKGGHLEKAE